MSFTTKGLIIKETQMLGPDKILTIFTEDYGFISAIAKRSKSYKSSLFSGVALFAFSEFVFSLGKGMYVIDEAQVITAFFVKKASIEGVSLAVYFSELALLLVCGNEDIKDNLHLLLNCLHLIDNTDIELLLIKSVYELRTVSDMGYMPAIIVCDECAVHISPRYFLDVKSGKLYCEQCSKKFKLKPNLDAASIEAIRYIIFSNIKDIFKFKIAPSSLHMVSMQVERFILFHTDKIPLTLKYFKKIYRDVNK